MSRVADPSVSPTSSKPAQRADLARGKRAPWWVTPAYRLGRLAARFTWVQTIRCKVLRRDAPERAGPYLLAPTHISHLEPFIVGTLVRRQIDWISRVEFYGRWWSAAFLNLMGAFRVNRSGVAVSTVRTALLRLAHGRVVGIFPEGGVARGADSVCRGAKIKRGVCLIAYRANVPVVPCVILGTHTLNEVAPWLPFRRARVWVAFGEPVWPDLSLAPKLARAKMAEDLERAYVSIYQEMLATYGLDDGWVP